MKKYIILIGCFVVCGLAANAQQNNDALPQNATVDECVQYALKHYPVVREQLLNEKITQSQIKTKIADWYPQISASGSLQHYFQLPNTLFNGALVSTSPINSTGVTFGLTQNIFNRDALLAAQTKSTVLHQAQQNTASSKIDVIVNVRKAFYDVALTKQQIDVLNEDIIRLQKSFNDAKSRYNADVADNTDYKRALISLNNSVAQQKAQQALLTAKYTTLKQYMGYPENQELLLQPVDSSSLESQAVFDTNTVVNPKNRIEYQQLQTAQDLNYASLKYEKWSYLPTVSGVAQYNLSYMNNNNFFKMFNNNYPNSFVGLQVGLPIFQGGKRSENIRIAQMQIEMNKIEQENMVGSINSDYQNALAVYKGDYTNYNALKENVNLARDVYHTISLQYQVGGIITYLDVITAETDLRTAEINYANALYQLIVDKVEIDRALGLIQY